MNDEEETKTGEQNRNRPTETLDFIEKMGLSYSEGVIVEGIVQNYPHHLSSLKNAKAHLDRLIRAAEAHEERFRTKQIPKYDETAHETMDAMKEIANSVIKKAQVEAIKEISVEGKWVDTEEAAKILNILPLSMRNLTKKIRNKKKGTADQRECGIWLLSDVEKYKANRKEALFKAGKKSTPQSRQGPNKCSRCGRPGHRKTTCTYKTHVRSRNRIKD